jgi:acetyl-CoA carboxylase carboxyltransferase component
LAVQNSYISAFQSLGALGLVLGTFGIAAVQLRSIFERRKELEAESDPEKRDQLFHSLLAGLYAKGRAIEAATHLEIDAVIDPADTRRLVSRAFAAAAG